MVPEDYNPEQFHQLILSAGNYSSKIQNFSNKIVDAPIQQQLECLTQVYNLLRNPSIPVIKKLFALRFVKDTMLLASLTFYESVLVTVYPWILDLVDCLDKESDQKLSQAAVFLRGTKELPTAEISVCKNFINLVEDLIKWMGTYIQEHPYSKAKFKSAFRILLERLPQIQKTKVTKLNFFKPEDPNRYQAYYLQRQTGELEGQKFASYVRDTLDSVEQGSTEQLLIVMLETGDENIINYLIEQFDTRFEETNRKNADKGMNLLEYLHQLFLVGDIQFCNRVKLEILPKITIFLQMLNHYKIQHKYTDAAGYFVNKLAKWQLKCQQLKLPTSSFERSLSVLKKQQIHANMNQYDKSVRYVPMLRLTKDINKDKTPMLTFNQGETINMIKSNKFLPVQESIQIRLEQQSSSSRNSMKEPSNSSKSSVKKAQYLQAYSKIPNKQPPKNPSEVKQIYFQHSNLSDRFMHHTNTPQHSTKPLLMSFKKIQSNEVFISDSFKGMPKNVQNNRIGIIQQSEQSGIDGELSKPPKIHINQEKQHNQVIPNQSPHISRSESEIIELYQQSNKQSNQNYAQKLSKISQGSQYYGNVKHTAKFTNNNYSKISKQNSIQHNQNSQQHPVSETATLNGAKRQKQQRIQKQQVNEYMLPQNDSQHESIKFSKKIVKPKAQKASSIRSSRSSWKSRQKMRPMFRSNDKDKEGLLLSPRSKISASRSIKVLKFNENEQGYQLPTSTGSRTPIQPIKVEKSLTKPKFGFIQTVEAEDTYPTEQKDNMKVGEMSQVNINSFSKSQSYSVPLSLEESAPMNQIPSNFGDLLRHTPETVKKNTFNNKIKELQYKISELKEKKVRYEKQVFNQNQEITKLKSEMPIPASQLEQENRQLLKALVKPKQIPIQKDFRVSKRQQFMGEIKQISASHIKEELKRQILYSKCKLFENEQVQIGMQLKEKVLSFYFTFREDVEECSVRTIQNSVKFQENIDAKIYKIHAKKQIKFKAVITDLQLFHDQCECAQLKVELKRSPKDRKQYTITIPYHTYNQLVFEPPNLRSTVNISTDWHFCSPSLYSNKHFLEDFLPQGKYHQSSYLTKIHYKDNSFSYLVIIEGDKFKIQFDKKQCTEQIPIIKCLIQLFQK